MLKKLIRQLMQAASALAVTFPIGNWAVHYAYADRKYEAVGGEYLFISVVYLGVYAGSGCLMEILEQIRSRRNRERQLMQAEHDDKGVTGKC